MLNNNFYAMPETVGQIQTSRTYNIDFEQGVIDGYIDGIDAVKQAVFFVLNTERFQYLIYDSTYGVELVDLIGQDLSNMSVRIKSAIDDALLQDERINDILDFKFEKQGEKSIISFVVSSIYGDYEQKFILQNGGVSV